MEQLTDTQQPSLPARECRACMANIVPVSRKRSVMTHQSGDPYQFGLYKRILCCPECGERDI